MRSDIEITVTRAGKPSGVVTLMPAAESVAGAQGYAISVVVQHPDRWSCKGFLAGGTEGFWRLVANAAAFAANEEEKR